MVLSELSRFLRSFAMLFRSAFEMMACCLAFLTLFLVFEETISWPFLLMERFEGGVRDM